MTTTIDPPTPDVTSGAVAGGDYATGATAAAGVGGFSRRLRRRPRTTIAWVVVGVVTLLLAILVVEDPVAHVWYQARQGRLASQGGTVGAIRDGRQVGVISIDYPPSSTGSAAATQKLYVVQGDATNELRGGPGHQPETPLPGERGNVVVFGHRHDWGAPFARLSTLATGDQIQAQSVNATQPTIYTVRSARTVAAGDTTLLGPTDDYRLTLVTDAGGRRSGRWLVVTAVSGVQRPGPVSNVGVAGPAKDPLLLNAAMASLVLLVAIGALIVVGLRRRSRVTTIWIMLAPLIAAALLAFVLELDLVWVPLA
jgi:LPXTG-site transpeptidase (sortase) family protein